MMAVASVLLPAVQALPVDTGRGVYGPPGDYIVRSLTPYDPEPGSRELPPDERFVDSLVNEKAEVSTRSTAWEPTVKVSGSPDRTIVGEWDEDATPQGTLIAGWITSSGGIGCGFKSSTDGGKTWSAPHYADGSSAGGDPVIIPDLSNPGTVYELCIVQSGGTKNVISKSTDDGKTWSAWDGPSWSPVTLDYPMLVARNQVLVMAFNQGQADTNVIYSTDDGKTWSSKLDVAAGWPNCIEQGVGTDDLYIFSGNGGQSLTFQKSADFGKTWSSAKTTGVSGGSRASCVTDKASGNIYAVTMDNTEVTLARTTDGGTTFTQHAIHTGSGMGDMGSAAYASLAVDNTGALHVGFLSNQGGQRHAYYSKSTDQGATWSAAEKISDHTGAGTGGQIAHYGHGMAWIPGGTRVCFGYTIVQTSGMEYRHTCSGSGGGGGGGGGLARIEVKPDPGTVAADQTLQFTATGYNSNNTPVPISPTWTSTDGTVSATGLYTPGGKVGSYKVEAAVGAIKGQATVNVLAGALSSIDVTPGSAVITADQTQQFSAAGADSKGNPVTIAPVWSTSGGAVDGSGVYTPARTGQFDVTATSGGTSGKATITVDAGQPVTLVLDPATATVPADSTQPFKALATDAKGNEAQVSASWKLEGGAAAGSVSPNGLFTPNKVGRYKVTATAGALGAEATVDVVPGKLSKVTITPRSASLSIGESKLFTVNITDSKGNPITSLAPEWEVVGGVGSVSDGTFTPSKAGSGKVKVTVRDGTLSKSDEATVSVKENPLASVGFANIMDLLTLIIGLVVLLVIVGVVVSVLKKRKRKEDLQGWMQGYDGQPYPEQQQLQQWMQDYNGPPPGGPPRQ